MKLASNKLITTLVAKNKQAYASLIVLFLNSNNGHPTVEIPPSVIAAAP